MSVLDLIEPLLYMGPFIILVFIVYTKVGMKYLLNADISVSLFIIWEIGAACCFLVGVVDLMNLLM